MSPIVKIKTFFIIVFSVFFIVAVVLDMDFSANGMGFFYASLMSFIACMVLFNPIGNLLQQMEDKKQNQINEAEADRQRKKLRDEEFEDWYRREAVKMQVEIAKTIAVMKMSHENDLSKLRLINEMEQEFENSKKNDLAMLSAHLERLKNI